MAKIYTRTGDGGQTSLADGSRAPKSDPRVALYGEVDELNSLLGGCVAILAREALGEPVAGLAELLTGLQSRLFSVGAVLADPGQSAAMAALPLAEQPFPVDDLERAIDAVDAHTRPLRRFILPGGCEASAWLHLARSVCRRIERQAVALSFSQPVPQGIIVFFNRLSDFLFTAARGANAAAGVPDVPWIAQPDGGLR